MADDYIHDHCRMLLLDSLKPHTSHKIQQSGRLELWLPTGQVIRSGTGDQSKREKRRQQIVELLAQPSGPVAWLLCDCGAPARYEVNRITSVEFVCRKRLPDDFG